MKGSATKAILDVEDCTTAHQRLIKSPTKLNQSPLVRRLVVVGIFRVTVERVALVPSAPIAPAPHFPSLFAAQCARYVRARAFDWP